MAAISRISPPRAGEPGRQCVCIALRLTLASGFLFGAVPVRQVLHTSPYEIVKSGSSSGVGRRMMVRDLLLVAQIAICAVLVTSSMVAARGLVRSLHSHFGFEPRNAMLVNTVLDMAGYRGDAVPALQRRMIDAMETIPGVTSLGGHHAALRAGVHGADVESTCRRLGQLLGDTVAVTALLDRLLHDAHVLKCGPRSWRTKVQADLRPEEGPK